MAFTLVSAVLFVIAAWILAADIRRHAWAGIVIWIVPVLLAFSATLRDVLLLRGPEG